VPWFRCFIHGENFPGALIGGADPVGFYTTRFVEADDPEAAELAGLAMLRADPHLAPPPDFTPTGEAKVFFERIEEIPPEDVPAVQAGFTWYAERDGE
jgi:hypothetical protein